MNTSAAAKIRLAIKRTRGFRDWFKRTVPKRAVDLNIVLHDPTQCSKTGVDAAESKPAGKLIACGTVGCVLGWSRAYPPLRRRLREGVSSYDYLGVWLTGDDSLFDGWGPVERPDQKAAAVARLNLHIKQLHTALKDVA